MSSFNATFNAAGSGDCQVVDCNYAFRQAVDEKGRPSSRVQGGVIKVTIIPSEDSSIISWMLDPYKQDSGKITFKRIDQDSILKEISFNKAYCVEFEENFNARGADTNTAMTLSLTISADEIVANGATHKNKWDGLV